MDDVTIWQAPAANSATRTRSNSGRIMPVGLRHGLQSQSAGTSRAAVPHTKTGPLSLKKGPDDGPNPGQGDAVESVVAQWRCTQRLALAPKAPARSASMLRVAGAPHAWSLINFKLFSSESDSVAVDGHGFDDATRMNQHKLPIHMALAESESTRSIPSALCVKVEHDK